MTFLNLDKYGDLGILILRIGIGLVFMWHGYAKLSGGTEHWTNVGGALSSLGIHFAPTVLGFIASITEFGGGLLLIIGLFTRPASFFLFITMALATAVHIANGDPRQIFTHPLCLAVVFLSLIFIGPGRFSVDGD